MTRNVVGVLGGMGPEATLLLQQRVMATVQANDDADHLPLIIDMNPQVPSRIAHLIEGTGPDPAPVIAKMAQRLEAAGATALAMPCNTAHHYAPQIEASVQVPMLNMVDLAVDCAQQAVGNGAKVGVLASPAVLRAGVFEAAFARADFTAVWPQDADRMLQAIRMIKAQGPTGEALQILSDTANELARNEASLLFVACSEFSLLSPLLSANVPVIDTIDVLAEAIYEHTVTKSS